MEEAVLEKGSFYAYLSEEISRYVEGLYQGATKINNVSTDDEPSGSPVALIVAAALLAAGGGAWVLFGRKKRKS